MAEQQKQREVIEDENFDENRRKDLKRKKEEEDSSRSKRKKKKKDGRHKKRSHSNSNSRRRRSRSKYSDESSSSSYSEDSSDSESSETWSGESDSEEEEKRRRKIRERRRKRKEREKKRKRKDKDKEKKRNKKKDKVKGAVTNSWGKYGIIRETDMWNKRPEFTAWLLEVKQVNLESLANWEEKQMFKEFMEDHNTATFPSSKYYDLDAYHRRKVEKQIKKGSKILETERTIFNDEEQRRQELVRAREKQKEEQVEVLMQSMQSGMAQAMKEQAQLKEEMAYQYKLGNFEAAAAIQRRLDPDVAM